MVYAAWSMHAGMRTWCPEPAPGLGLPLETIGVQVRAAQDPRSRPGPGKRRRDDEEGERLLSAVHCGTEQGGGADSRRYPSSNAAGGLSLRLVRCH